VSCPFVAGIALITRTHFPHRVFARPEDMASFMARGLTGTLDLALAARLQQALRETRESAESQLPSTRPRPFNPPLSDALPRR